MIVLDTAEALTNWDEYRTFMRERLKMMPEGESGPIYVSKTRLDFQISGKNWKGHAIVLGKKSRQMAQKLRREGVLFIEGSCRKNGKQVAVSGLSGKLAEGAIRTLDRLKLPFELVVDTADDGAVEASDEATPGLGRQAQRLQKATRLWNQTRDAATAELRKLQRAIQALGDPRGKAVIRTLESIVTRLASADDHAQAAVKAARAGDTEAFAQVRESFQRRMRKMLEYVETDPMMRDADENPSVPLNLRAILTKSLTQLVKA